MNASARSICPRDLLISLNHSAHTDVFNLPSSRRGTSLRLHDLSRTIKDRTGADWISRTENTHEGNAKQIREVHSTGIFPDEAFALAYLPRELD